MKLKGIELKGTYKVNFYNEHLQVWVGLTDGGRVALFSDEYDESKPLHYDQQFRTLQRVAGCKLEREYI